MDVGLSLRMVTFLRARHERRRSEFVMPSAVRPGHRVTVLRLDTNPRGLSESDLHFLIHVDVPPGQTRDLTHYVGRPHNRFRITMSAEAVYPKAPTLGRPTASASAPKP